MNKQYVEKLATKWGLENTYLGDKVASFTLLNQASDSVQLQITVDHPNPTIIVNGQDIHRTQKEYMFDNMHDAIKCLAVFKDYYDLVVTENFKQF